MSWEIIALLTIVCIVLGLATSLPPRTARYYRRALPPRETHFVGKTHPKPEWVRDELTRLKALMPSAGCRRLADTFNRLPLSIGMTVSKTYVNDLLRRKHYEVIEERRRIRGRPPRAIARNRVWAIDLSGKTDLNGQQHVMLAIIEHASRACLSLEALPSKSSAQLLLNLCQTVRRFGLPRSVRTDNERIFSSHWFRWGLTVLGIRHQRTEVACPWMNGRVERFFGTLKTVLNQLTVVDLGGLQNALRDLRFYYNHVRPHQALAGRTPAESWDGQELRWHRPRAAYWFEAWQGLLSGFYQPL